ncbi:MAG: NUDIX domain-containing protein [Cyclobacteriaceae bacterium]|jgi:8-oxo-dGTP diphosphatase
MEEKIIEKFGNKLRVRVCGILIEKGKILLIRHKSIGKNGVLWAPPGGGMLFAESAEETIKREFEEETGLKIKVERFLFTHEFLKPPLHAIELFFEVSRLGGALNTGYDPEMKKNEQIITDAAYLDIDQIREIDNDSIHNVLRKVTNLKDLLYLDGYVKFEEFT